jgi:hypothetical protein
LSSISFYAESQYRLLETSFFSSAPNSTPYSPGSTASLDEVVVIVRSWTT